MDQVVSIVWVVLTNHIWAGKTSTSGAQEAQNTKYRGMLNDTCRYLCDESEQVSQKSEGSSSLLLSKCGWGTNLTDVAPSCWFGPRLVASCLVQYLTYTVQFITNLQCIPAWVLQLPLCNSAISLWDVYYVLNAQAGWNLCWRLLCVMLTTCMV